MSGRASMLLMIAVCALATPAAAQAPTSTTTGFDGTYVGCHIHSRKAPPQSRHEPGRITAYSMARLQY